MKVILLRHGETEYNAKKWYQGSRDIPLSPAGRLALGPAPFAPARVYVSPMKRAVETAQLLFPGAALYPVPGLREMDFGAFEGRGAQEMIDDPDYRAWVDGGCLAPPPGGEGKEDFCRRVCAAFAPLVDRALSEGEDTMTVLSHGGTVMAVMERYALPHKPYFQWLPPNAGGFVLDAGSWAREGALTYVETVRYAREAGV